MEENTLEPAEPVIEIQAPPITCILIQDGRVYVDYRLETGDETVEFTELSLLAEAVGVDQAARLAAEAGWYEPQ